MYILIINNMYIKSNWYTRFIFFVVSVDIIRIAVEADIVAQSEYIAVHPSFYYIQSIKLMCFAVYFLDLVIRFSAQLGSFFWNIWNILDLFVFFDYIVVFAIYATFPYFRTYTGLRLLRGM